MMPTCGHCIEKKAGAHIFANSHGVQVPVCDDCFCFLIKSQTLNQRIRLWEMTEEDDRAIGFTIDRAIRADSLGLDPAVRNAYPYPSKVAGHSTPPGLEEIEKRMK
jgi:hypothetical protein